MSSEGGIGGGGQGKATLIFLGFVLVLVAGAVLLITHKSGPGKASPESTLQTYIDKHASKAVISSDVKTCRDATKDVIGDTPGQQGGVVYDKAYACPVEITTAQGTGCIGVLYAFSTKSSDVAVVDVANGIDPRACA